MILPNRDYPSEYATAQAPARVRRVNLGREQQTGIKKWVVEHPGLSIAAAVAIGLSLGWIVRR